MRRSNGNTHLRPPRPFEGDATGFTLLEVILAMSLLTVGLLAVASLQVSAIKGNAHANHITEATTLAQEKVEDLMATVYSSVTSGSDQVDRYTRTWTVDPNGPTGVANTKVIQVTVSGGDLRKNVVLTSLVMDPDA